MDAVWAGAAALPLLLALYLLKLRRRPVRVSSVMFWPRASKDVQVNVPLRLVRPSWLLLLHLLIVLLLLGALARPAVEGRAPAGGRVVLLVDASASMSARDREGGPTRLESAKARATRLARELTRAGASVGLIVFAAEASVGQGFTQSRALLEAAIGTIEPTDQPGDLRAALALGEALAGEAGEAGEDDPTPPTLVVIGDGGYAQPAARTAGTALAFERIGPEPGMSLPVNAGITRLAARRDYADPAVVRVLVEVRGSAASTRVLTLTLNAGLVAQRAIELVASPEGWGAFASFEFAAPGGGLVLASLGGGDALASDDEAGLVLDEPRRPSMLLVRPEQESAADFLLEDVLRELRPSELRIVNEAQWAAMNGAGADLVILDRVGGALPAGAAAICFGVLPALDGLAGEAAVEAMRGETPLYWKREHPVMRDVAMDAVVAAGSFAYRATGVRAGLSEVVLGPRGAMVMVDEGPPRRVMVGFELARSNWALQAGFAIFMANAVDYLTLRGEASSGRSFTTGERVDVRATGRVTLEGPVVVQGQGNAGGVAVLGLIPRAGVYVVRGESSRDKVVCVNVANGVESRIQSPQEIDVGGALVSAGAGLTGPREVWAYLVMAAGVLLAVEWVIYAARVRV